MPLVCASAGQSAGQRDKIHRARRGGADGADEVGRSGLAGGQTGGGQCLANSFRAAVRPATQPPFQKRASARRARDRWWNCCSVSPIRASAFRRRPSGGCSIHLPRWMSRPRAALAVRVWDWRSAGAWSISWAGHVGAERRGQGLDLQFLHQDGVCSVRPRPFLAGPKMHLGGRHMLIVDDNARTDGFSRHWSQGGDGSRAAQSGSEALAWLRAGEVFDVAVLDMQMPDMDGVMLAREMRLLPGGDKLPLILLSSLGQREVTSEKNLFNAALTKPVKPSQLFDLLPARSKRRRRPLRPRSRSCQRLRWRSRGSRCGCCWPRTIWSIKKWPRICWQPWASGPMSPQRA